LSLPRPGGDAYQKNRKPRNRILFDNVDLDVSSSSRRLSSGLGA
jgi:hypothetical protein